MDLCTFCFVVEFVARVGFCVCVCVCVCVRVCVCVCVLLGRKVCLPKKFWVYLFILFIYLFHLFILLIYLFIY